MGDAFFDVRVHVIRRNRQFIRFADKLLQILPAQRWQAEEQHEKTEYGQWFSHKITSRWMDVQIEKLKSINIYESLNLSSKPTAIIIIGKKTTHFHPIGRAPVLWVARKRDHLKTQGYCKIFFLQ